MGRNALLKLDKSRRQVRLSKPRVAVLGDESGNIYDRETGMYLLRYLGAADAQGNAQPGGTVFRAFGGQVNFIEQANRQVKVITNDEGQKEIVGPVWRDAQQAGIRPYTVHPNTPYRQFLRLADVQNFLAKPVNRNSMKVRIGELFFVDRFGVPQFFPGTNEETHLDLTSYIPATANYECVALISFDQDRFSAGTPPYFGVATSTPQAILPPSATGALSINDVREAYGGRAAYSLPVQVYRLYNGMTKLAEDPVNLDNRQFVNVPATVSNPNPIVITSEDESVTIVEDPVGTFDLSVAGSTDTGITELTGDVTAGPGNGSQAATITANAVTNTKIADNAVTQAKLADNSVGTAEIIDANVTNAKLATDAVTQAKIADNAVGTAEIIDLNVTSAKIAANAVTQGKLGNDVLHKATVAPTVTDDASAGYPTGAHWIDTAAKKEYVSTDSTNGAAVWKETTLTGTGTVSTLVMPSAVFDVSGNGTSTVTVIFDNQTANTGFYGPASGSAAAPTFRAMVTNDIPDQTVTGDKIADATIPISKLSDDPTAAYNVIGYDADGVPGGVANGDIINGELGENVTVNDFIIEKPDNKWYKANTTYASLVMAPWLRRGVAISGTMTTGSTIRIMRRGYAYDFSGLTPGAVMYAHTTAGAYTFTEPTPTLDSTPAIIAPWGRAEFTGTMWVDTYQPVIYRFLRTMSDGGTLAVTHHPNVPAQSRTVTARTYGYEDALIETYPSSNQDASKQIRGQSGAGALVTVDTAGTTLAALGDNGGNEFMVAQSVQLTAGTLSQVTFNTGTSAGTPSGPATIEIRANNAGIPAVTSLYSGTQAITASSTITHNITGGLFLDAGLYWIVISVPAQATNSRFSVQYSSTNPYAAGKMLSDSSASAGTWAVALTGGASADMRCTITTAAQAANDALAQGTSHSSTSVLTSVNLWLRKVGSPTGSLKASIFSNSAGVPGSVIANGDSSTVLASSLSTSYSYITFTFALNPSITASTQYHIVLTTTDSASNTNYVEWGIDTSSPSYANGVLSVQNPSWASASPAADGCFQLYAQGTQFEEDIQLAQWTGGIGQYAVRRGDSSGANKSTVTQFMNISGGSMVMNMDVSVP